VIGLDGQLLCEVGLGTLDVSAGNRVLRHCYEELEFRIGVRLADRISDAQLDQLVGYVDAEDHAGACRWLETTCPDYNLVAREEFGLLKAQLSAESPAILAIEAALGPGRERYERHFDVLDEQVRQPALRLWPRPGDWANDNSNTNDNL